MKYSEYRESVREDGNPIKHGLEGADEPEPTLQFHELFIVGLVAAAIFAIIILGRANHVF
jgi:hypothetical protein